MAFISRCATDFSAGVDINGSGDGGNSRNINDNGNSNNTALNWVTHLMQTNSPEANSQIEEAIFDIVNMLSLSGKNNTAFNHWLPLLEQSQEPKIKGRRLNLQGKLCRNLSQYDTALDYLNQSLTIRQAIGDKAGACVTLFNLGHIYAQKKRY